MRRTAAPGRRRRGQRVSPAGVGMQRDVVVDPTPHATETKTTRSAAVLPGGPAAGAAAPEPQDELADPTLGAEPSWDPT